MSNERNELEAAHALRDKLLSNYLVRSGPRGKVREGSCCWIWQGSCGDLGYGHLVFNYFQYQVHRLMWVNTYGPVPDGLNVLHHCDVRNCLNPDHLWLGTQQDNVDDMWAKGRGQAPPYCIGSQTSQHLLTESDVIKILQRVDQGISPGLVASEFRVKVDTIRAIFQGRNWCHVEGPRQKPRQRRPKRFKGVTPNGSCWNAYARENGKPVHLGYFGFEVDAAIARNYWDAYHGKPLLNEISADEMFHD